MKKNNFRKKFAVWALFFCSLFITGCASKPVFEGKGDLCGLIVDENNLPVKDFVVYCKSAEEKNISARAIVPVITNESGMFVFFGLPSGDYLISGEKKNYQKLQTVPYAFNDRTKILCLQINSFKAALMSVDELLHLGQKEEAGEILASISFEEKSKEEMFLKAFEFYATADEEEKSRLLQELKCRQFSVRNQFFYQYLAKLDENFQFEDDAKLEDDFYFEEAE